MSFLKAGSTRNVLRYFIDSNREFCRVWSIEHDLRQRLLGFPLNRDAKDEILVAVQLAREVRLRHLIVFPLSFASLLAICLGAGENHTAEDTKEWEEELPHLIKAFRIIGLAATVGSGPKARS